MQCNPHAKCIPTAVQPFKHNVLCRIPLKQHLTLALHRQQQPDPSPGAHNHSSRHHPTVYAAINGTTNISASEITILVKESTDHLSLAAIVRDHQRVLNFIHAAAAFTHAAQLAQQLILGNQQLLQQQQQQGIQLGANGSTELQGQQQQHWLALIEALPLLLQTVQLQVSSFQGRQVANCLWAANKLLHVLVDRTQQQQQQDDQRSPVPAAVSQLQQQLLRVAQKLLQQAAHCWHLFSGQELVLLLYAVTNMPTIAAAAVASGTASSSTNSGTSSRSSSIMDTGAADGEGAALPADEVHAPASAAAASAAVDMSWANTAVQHLQKLHRANKLRLKPQEFEMLMISLRKLQQQQQCTDPTQQQQQQLQMPTVLLQQLLSAAADRSHRCSSRDIAGILYSAAALGLKPNNSVITKLLTPLGPGSKTLRSCNSVDVTNILYALAVLRYKPQQQQQQGREGGAPAIKGLILQLLQQRQQFPPSEMAVCVYALARLQIRLPAAAVSLLVAAAVQGLQPAQQRELVLLLWGSAAVVARLNPVIIHALLVKYLKGCTAAAAGASSVPTCPVASALATAAATAEADPAESEPQQPQQQYIAAQHVSMLLWSLGKLAYCPPKLLLLPLLQLSQSLLQYAGSEHLACICWGLAKTGVKPSRVWLSGLYGRLLQLAEQLSPDQATRQQGLGVKGLTAQTLAMIVWGSAHLEVARDAASIGESAAAAVEVEVGEHETAVGHHITNVDMLGHVILLSQSVLQSSPLSVGMIMWGCVRLGLAPETRTLQAALHAFSGNQRHQQGSRWQQQGQGRGVSRQQQQQQQWSVQQQQRYAQSLALTVWALARLGASEELKQQLMAVLRANVQQLRWFSPMDLTTIIWGLNQLQLRPPTPWLLNFYISSQSRFDQFTDARLASLVVPLHVLLERQPFGEGTGVQQQQQQPLSQAPPAVWLLQLELQVQSRWKRRRRKRGGRQSGSTGFDETEATDSGKHGSNVQAAAVQEQQGRLSVYDPLRIVAGMLRRWRSMSIGTSAAAAS